MWPTLRPGDVLRVEVASQELFRVGDILVFADRISGELVAHRLVSAGPHGLMFRGDNNDSMDAVVLGPGSIVGRVLQVERRDRIVSVPGGLRGRIQGLRRRIAKRFRRYFSTVIASALTRGSLGKRLSTIRLNTRLVSFESYAGTEYQLFWRSISVGRYRADKKCWQIRFPFRLFIDETKLLTDK